MLQTVFIAQMMSTRWEVTRTEVTNKSKEPVTESRWSSSKWSCQSWHVMSSTRQSFTNHVHTEQPCTLHCIWRWVAITATHHNAHSQTNAELTPYCWTLDKRTTNRKNQLHKIHNCILRPRSSMLQYLHIKIRTLGCVNYKRCHYNFACSSTKWCPIFDDQFSQDFHSKTSSNFL